MADAALPPRAQTADGALNKSSSEVNIRFLRTQEAFNKTHHESPAWIIAGRLPRDDSRGKAHTEPGPDISTKLNCARPKPPQWSVQGRWKAEPPAGAWVPAPGTYKNPGTMNKHHPTIPCKGRGWHWGSDERQTMEKAPPTPSPDRYRDNRKDAVTHKEPSWSIIGRPDNAGIKHKKELHTSTAYSEPQNLRNTFGMHHKGGVTKQPEWKLNGRPESSLIPARDSGEKPGPDTYRPQYGGVGAPCAPYAKIKRSPSFGFGSSTRFEKPRDVAHVL